MSKKELLSNVLMHLVFTLILAGVIALLSANIPIWLFFVAFGIELILIFVITFNRKKGSVGFVMLYLFAIFSGMTLGYAIDYYVDLLGAMTVVYIFIGTAAIFAVMAKLGWDEKKNLLSWGRWLLIAVLILIVALVINIFIQSAMLTLFAGLVGILIFSASIMYNLNVMMRLNLQKEDVPSMVVGLYLDFVNLFLSILRAIGVISSND